MRTKSLLNVLRGQPTNRRPVWFYRQAGRYLPEYKKIRTQVKDFLTLCLTPAYATEITLQPVRRFDLDAAIVFADILLVPFALGRTLTFQESGKPVLEPLSEEHDLSVLRWRIDKLEPVFETLSCVKTALSAEQALIGFSGSPWTVAAYMLDGGRTTGFLSALSLVRNAPLFLEKLIEILVQVTVDYLKQQIIFGAEVIQLFDSWAGLLSGDDFFRFVIQPTRTLVLELKRTYPDFPIIGFPRGATKDDYRLYFTETGVDALALDQHISLMSVETFQQTGKPLQGNLDPQILVEGGIRMERAVEDILSAFGPQHIFNLGHGILPQTPPDHIASVIGKIRTWTEENESRHPSS